MTPDELTGIIVHESYQVYFKYGPGLFERVYESVLEGRLKARGLRVERQKTVHIEDEYLKDEPAFIADLIVEGLVVVELKSVEKLTRKHFKQVTTYCKLTRIRRGLLINFDCDYLKNNIKRVVVGYD